MHKNTGGRSDMPIYPCFLFRLKEIAMTQNDLLTVDGKTFASKADSIVEGREVLKGQSKLMLYGGKLYPSADIYCWLIVT